MESEQAEHKRQALAATHNEHLGAGTKVIVGTMRASAWSPTRTAAGWWRRTGWPRSPGTGGRGGTAAGGGAVGPAARGQPGPGRPGVRGRPGDDLAVGPGADRGRGGRAGPGAARPEGRLEAGALRAARIAEPEPAGQTLRQIAAATGVSTFSVRSALGRVASRGQALAAGEKRHMSYPEPKYPGANGEIAQCCAVWRTTERSRARRVSLPRQQWRRGEL
jgi:hypothetical protein